jgi:peptidoglycan-associated lipoprotein
MLMKWNLAAALLAVLVVEMHAAPPADACGVKLTVKSSTPRKAVARTSNPSDILLLGNPPRRLEADLSASGHRVEVAPSASAAKKKNYAVVITDANLQDEARSNFDGSIVIVRSGDVVADMRSVEQGVARRPVRTEESRPVVAAREARTPIAAGPVRDPNRRIVGASQPKDTPAVTEPTPPAATPTPPTPPPQEKVATTVPKVPETKQPEATPPPTEPKPSRPAPVAKVAVVAPNTVHDEVYFTLGSAKLDRSSTVALAKAIRWLSANTDAQVVIEGHADPTGTPEGNMALGQKRAELVRDYLVSGGVDQSRLEVISYGDTRLRYGKADRRNRRAAIVTK